MAAVALGTVVALILSEGLIRLAAPKRLETIEAADFAQFDPWFGWTNRPGAAGPTRAAGQYDTSARINSRGLRDREIAPARTGAGVRVLCLGDSFTWGWGVGNDETYPKVLERELPGSEGINAGVCGWGTAQELLWLEREGLAYAPDAVVLGFYLNDFADNASDSGGGYRRPTYALDGGRLVLRNVPIQGPRGGPLVALGAFARSHLLTLRLILAAWQWIDRGFFQGADLAPIARARLLGPGPQPPPAEAETGAILAEAKRLCDGERDPVSRARDPVGLSGAAVGARAVPGAGRGDVRGARSSVRGREDRHRRTPRGTPGGRGGRASRVPARTRCTGTPTGHRIAARLLARRLKAP